MHCNVIQYNVRYNAMQCFTIQCAIIQCNAMQCFTIQCAIIQCNAMQCFTIQCAIIQCNALQCYTIQCAIQCNAMQPLPSDPAYSSSSAWEKTQKEEDNAQGNAMQYTYHTIPCVMQCIPSTSPSFLHPRYQQRGIGPE